MNARWRKWASGLHLTVILALVVTLLSACGSLNVEESYPLESVNRDGNQTSYVYRAAGETVPAVAQELADQKKPEQMSKEDPDHMFLVYSDQIVHVQKDQQNPEDTLIEVDSEEYVRQNYSPSFLEGYLLASLVGSLFDSSRPIGGYGDYRGYGSLNTNPPAKGTYHAPTADDMKTAPPVTVQKKGSIFKRTTSGDGTGAGSDGLFGKKKSTTGSGTTGSITRGDSGSGSSKSSGSWLSPRKSTTPRTKVGGFGRISRRR